MLIRPQCEPGMMRSINMSPEELAKGDFGNADAKEAKLIHAFRGCLRARQPKLNCMADFITEYQGWRALDFWGYIGVNVENEVQRLRPGDTEGGWGTSPFSQFDK